jgi:hypothetical protein
MKHSIRLVFTALPVFAGMLGAQVMPAPDAVTTLSSYVVTEVPIEQSVNPLTRESSGIFGDARNPLATPRAASTITAALLNERAIHGVREIVTYSPGAYASSSYGKASVPTIRGDTAETYLNGQRRSNNLYGFLPSFNGVEAVDVVRGPGPAVFGSGFFSGGYVNYITKQPKFVTAPETVVTTRIGTWVPGESGLSYLNGSIQIDTTGEVDPTLAYRVSYEGKDGDTFFKRAGVRDDREDVFAALTWKPRPGFTLDFNAQYLWQASPEILGVNRPTQELIDHGWYYTGNSPDTPGFPGLIPATQRVDIPRDATLFSRGDFSNANIAHAQLIATLVVSPRLTWVNRTWIEYVNRRRVHQFEYDEYVTQKTAENRTEAHLNFEAFNFANNVVTGATIRWEGRESYTNYFNEYFYNWDITNPAQVFNQSAGYPNSYFPGFVGPGGRQFFPASYDSPETDDSKLWNPAVFWQDEITLTDQLSLLAGLREDFYHARARDPLPDPAGPFFQDSASADSFSHNWSLLYRPTRTQSYYVTYQRVYATNGNVTGGGIILNVPDGKINRSDFRNLSELREAGAKFSFLDHRLYVGSALFDQQRTRVSLGGKHSDIRVRGLELETVYQPSTRLSATANATWQDGHYVDASPFQLGGRSIYDLYAAGRGPGGLGTGGQGTGEADPYANQVPRGNWPLLGFSKVMFNAGARYRWENGFGIGGGVQWQSRQRGNFDDQWHIPSQITVNAAVFYVRPRWEVNLDLLNVTDERNWEHNGDPYTASQLVFQELPFRAEGYFKLRF